MCRPKCLQDVYFVLYDMHDNIICYLDNVVELSKLIKVPRYKLNYYFRNNNENGYVYVNVDNHLCKLYKYLKH